MKRYKKFLSIMFLAGAILISSIRQMPLAMPNAASAPESTQNDLPKVFSTGLAITPYNNGGKAYGNWWAESEICAYIENIPIPVTKGGYGATAYIPDYALADGEYGIEISLCYEKSPFSFVSYASTDFVIKNGTLDENRSQECTWKRVPTGYLVDVALGYCLKETLDNYVLLLKVHSSATGANGCIYFGDLFFADVASGVHFVDLNDKALRFSAERLSDGEIQKTALKELKTDVVVTNAAKTLYVGERLNLKVKTSSSERQLTYTSSDKSVASISKTGKISAKKAGKTNIKVKDKISGSEFSWTLDVTDPYIAPQIEKNAILCGTSYQFFGVGYGLKTEGFTWTSSNRSVGEINEKNGLFQARKPGKTKITMQEKKSGKKYSFTVNVYDVTNQELRTYISVETNNLISPELEQKITELLYDVYPSVFDYFADGVYSKITCTFTEMDGVAYTTGRDIFVSSNYINSNPQDIDCVTHELIHCAQAYATYDDVWLIEGITDYGRSLFGRYNKEAGWKLSSYEPQQHYTDGYQVTGGFLKYIVENHNKNMISLLNRSLKQGSCPSDIWIKNTGHTIDELWELYKTN